MKGSSLDILQNVVKFYKMCKIKAIQGDVMVQDGVRGVNNGRIEIFA